MSATRPQPKDVVSIDPPSFPPLGRDEHECSRRQPHQQQREEQSSSCVRQAYDGRWQMS